ncbi:dTDP-4-dehydrorhamnose reductase [Oceanicoccus sp. KOV_DT_Chl]|uniref:dTDP-4-dehydrorhamnose reductase n=1 Tax=Oceanicoccus sp. KOV_DT_Chl TaxID=1904639 RepID=UPI000C7CD963|nr:dTDP-4-dehydrorhamnose reductase [Oceanicoccus sp. KOV_DT_Chl]
MNKSLAGQRVLITGVNGQVGRALRQEFGSHCELITASRDGQGADFKIDLENHAELAKIIIEVKPAIVINPAAYTQVDQAEDESELAFNVNSQAPGVMAEACKKIDAVLVHYSTDYVFSGRSNTPYIEKDKTDPLNVYGRSKREGEKSIQAIGCKHLIFRTCWVYDAHSRNFLNAIIEKARVTETLKVVEDQIGTPTSASFIADITWQVLKKYVESGVHTSGENSVFHLKPNGYCSWYDFAVAIIESARLKEPLAVKDIYPISSEALDLKAVRPFNSMLANELIKDIFDVSISDWKTYMNAVLLEKYKK